jgi:hypothetical protein
VNCMKNDVRRHWACAVMILAGVALCEAVAFPQEPAKPLKPLGIAAGSSGAAYLPEGTVAMIEARDVSATIERLRATALYKALTDPASAGAMKLLGEEFEKGMKDADDLWRNKLKLPLEDLVKMANGSVTIAITDVSVGPMPARVVVLLTPKDADHMNACVRRFAENIQTLTEKLPSRQLYGVNVTEIDWPGGNYGWAVAGNTLVVGVGKNTIPLVLRKMAEGGRSLAESPSFVAVREAMKDRAQDWMLYISTDRAVQLARALGGDEVDRVIGQYGLDQLKAIGYGGKLNGPAFDDVAFLHFAGPPGKLANLISPKPVDMQLLRCIPPDATQFVVARLNVQLGYDTLTSALQDFAPQAHEGLLKAIGDADKRLGMSLEREISPLLGEEIVLFNKPGPVAPLDARLKRATNDEERDAAFAEEAAGSAVMMVAIKDAAQIRKAVAQILALAVEDAAKDGVELRIIEEEHKGVAIRTLASLRGTTLQPGFAVSGQFLVFALSPAAIKSALDQSAAGSRSVADSPLWAGLKPHIPAGVGVVFVNDPAPVFGQFASVLMEGTLPDLKAEPVLKEEDAFLKKQLEMDIRPVMDAFARNAFPTVFTIYSGPDGVSLRSHSVFGMGIMGTLVAGGVVGATGKVTHHK